MPKVFHFNVCDLKTQAIIFFSHFFAINCKNNTILDEIIWVSVFFFSLRYKLFYLIKSIEFVLMLFLTPRLNFFMITQKSCKQKNEWLGYYKIELIKKFFFVIEFECKLYFTFFWKTEL
jgi:hypothetical protein